MDTVPIGARRRVDGGPVLWAREFVARVGHHWAENPWILATFAVRMLRAWRCLLVDLTPRQLGRTLWRFIRQTARTFVRGVFVVLALGLAIGLGTGVVARAAWGARLGSKPSVWKDGESRPERHMRVVASP